MSEMKALVLVGGLGTRLRDLVPDLPKPMAPFLGKPFLEYKVDWLRRQGFKSVVFCVGYKGELIRQHFGDGSRWGLRIEYSFEDGDSLLGTAGALKNAEDLVDGPFFAMNGDTYLRNDFQEMVDAANREGWQATILVCPPVNPKEEGKVFVDRESGEVTSFTEKPKERGIGDGPTGGGSPHCGAAYTNAGIYLFAPEVLDRIPAGRKVSLEYDLLPAMVEEGVVGAVTYDGYFIDIGVPRFHEKFGKDLESGLFPDCFPDCQP